MNLKKKGQLTAKEKKELMKDIDKFNKQNKIKELTDEELEELE